MDHREFASGRGTTIQAGLFAGLAGHGVDSSLKVMEIMYKILAFVVCRLIRSYCYLTWAVNEALVALRVGICLKRSWHVL